jgi:chromatin segregation and condensation protein Rec8/ScpA/Scc1 (kleisin family)
MVSRLINSRSLDEIVANFEELKANLTSMLESDDTDVRDNLIIAFYALLELSKVQAVNILEIRSQIAGLKV